MARAGAAQGGLGMQSRVLSGVLSGMWHGICRGMQYGMGYRIQFGMQCRQREPTGSFSALEEFCSPFSPLPCTSLHIPKLNMWEPVLLLLLITGKSPPHCLLFPLQPSRGPNPVTVLHIGWRGHCVMGCGFTRFSHAGESCPAPGCCSCFPNALAVPSAVAVPASSRQIHFLTLDFSSATSAALPATEQPLCRFSTKSGLGTSQCKWSWAYG